MAVKKAASGSAPTLGGAKKAATKKTGTAKKATSKGKLEPKTRAASASAAHLKLVGKIDTPPPSFDDLAIAHLFPLDAPETVHSATAAGCVYRTDGGFLDALRMVARRVETKDKKPELWINFKIAGPSRDDFEKRLEKKGAEAETLSFFAAEPKTKGKDTVLVLNGNEQKVNNNFYSHVQPDTSKTAANRVLRLEDGKSSLEFVPSDGAAALRGYVRIRLGGDEAAARKSLKSLVEKAGLQAAFAPPTETSLQRYALMKLLWHVSPKDAAKLAEAGPLADLKLPAIEKALKANGVSQSRIDALHYREVAPGHFTVMDPVGLSAMKKAGLKYAYSTVATEEHVLSILRYGQKATLTRWEEGMLVSGMSSMADLGSGGGQGVFSRLVTTAADGNTWTGRKYKIILAPEQLARLDVWGWNGDNYGRSWDLDTKNFGVELVKSVGGTGKDYESYNEIISPVGNGPDFIHCVVATSAADRNALIKFLKKEGYKPPKGKTIEKLVRVASKIEADLVS